MSIGNWKVTEATFSTEEPFTLTVSFQNPYDERERMTSTMPANKWHTGCMNGYRLEQEKKLVAEMGSRLNDALEEIEQLKRLANDKAL